MTKETINGKPLHKAVRMYAPDRSIQRRDDETEIAETVATTLEPSYAEPPICRGLTISCRFCYHLL